MYPFCWFQFCINKRIEGTDFCVHHIHHQDTRIEMAEDTEPKLYGIVKDTGYVVVFPHSSYEVCKKSAEFISKANPGKKFYIFSTIEAVETPLPITPETKFTKLV